jgi:signal transduction histidine kinase
MGHFTYRWGVALTAALGLCALLAWLGWREAGQQAAACMRSREALATLDGLTARLADADACRCAFLTRADEAARDRFRAAVASARTLMRQVAEDVAGLAERKLALLERSIDVRLRERFGDRRQLELTRQASEAGDALREHLAARRAEVEREADERAEGGWTSAGQSSVMACLAAGLALFGMGLAGAAAAGGSAARRLARERAERLAETRAALDALAALQAGLEAHFREAGRLASVGRVTSEVVHDFNNLLGVILACSETTLHGLPPDHPAREVLGQAIQAGHRAAALGRRVLAVGRGKVEGAGPCALNPTVCDLAPILRRVVGWNVEARLALAEGLPAVLADRSRLEQVLLNLAANARDAMPDGGTLTIETRLAGGRVVLSVADTGVGMDAATKGRVFEPFFTTKGEGQGTGLGMAIVRDAVAECGGAVEVDSEPGKGTCVRVWLRAAGGA